MYTSVKPAMQCDIRVHMPNRLLKSPEILQPSLLPTEAPEKTTTTTTTILITTTKHATTTTSWVKR
jgi:hypothetical protein